MKQKMKFISIMGDSISTYENYNPYGYAVYYDYQMQKKNGLCSVYDTWWMKVSQRLQASICVNNSYSGSRVSGKVFPAGESRDRISNLKSGKYSPDYILIYMGINDFANGVPDQVHCPIQIRKNTFEGAYNHMLKSIRTQYQNATVVCGTLMRTTIKDQNGWHFPEEYAADYSHFETK